MASLTLPTTPKNETVNLNYFQWKDLFLTEKPYQVLMDVHEEFPASNFKFEPAAAQTIQDIRGREASFNLDEHAFTVIRHPLNIEQWNLEQWNRETVEKKYLPQVEKMLRNKIRDVSDVVFFDWRVCCKSEGFGTGRAPRH